MVFQIVVSKTHTVSGTATYSKTNKKVIIRYGVQYIYIASIATIHGIEIYMVSFGGHICMAAYQVPSYF